MTPQEGTLVEPEPEVGGPPLVVGRHVIDLIGPLLGHRGVGHREQLPDVEGAVVGEVEVGLRPWSIWSWRART